MSDSPEEIHGPPPDWAKRVLVVLYEVITCVCVCSLVPGGPLGLPSWFDTACVTVWRWMPVLLAFQAIIAGIVLIHDVLTRKHGIKSEAPLGVFMVFGFFSILANVFRPRFM